MQPMHNGRVPRDQVLVGATALLSPAAKALGQLIAGDGAHVLNATLPLRKTLLTGMQWCMNAIDGAETDPAGASSAVDAETDLDAARVIWMIMDLAFIAGSDRNISVTHLARDPAVWVRCNPSALCRFLLAAIGCAVSLCPNDGYITATLHSDSETASLTIYASATAHTNDSPGSSVSNSRTSSPGSNDAAAWIGLLERHWLALGATFEDVIRMDASIVVHLHLPLAVLALPPALLALMAPDSDAIAPPPTPSLGQPHPPSANLRGTPDFEHQITMASPAPMSAFGSEFDANERSSAVSHPLFPLAAYRQWLGSTLPRCISWSPIGLDIVGTHGSDRYEAQGGIEPLAFQAQAAGPGAHHPPLAHDGPSLPQKTLQFDFVTSWGPVLFVQAGEDAPISADAIEVDAESTPMSPAGPTVLLPTEVVLHPNLEEEFDKMLDQVTAAFPYLQACLGVGFLLVCEHHGLFPRVMASIHKWRTTPRPNAAARPSRIVFHMALVPMPPSPGKILTSYLALHNDLNNVQPAVSPLGALANGAKPQPPQASSDALAAPAAADGPAVWKSKASGYYNALTPDTQITGNPMDLVFPSPITPISPISPPVPRRALPAARIDSHYMDSAHTPFFSPTKDVSMGPARACTPGSLTATATLFPQVHRPSTPPPAAFTAAPAAKTAPLETLEEASPTTEGVPAPSTPKRQRCQTIPKATSTIRVLLVEDNPINLHILTAFLSKRGIQYAAARDGESAVRMFTGAPPGSGNEFHLVLMDLQLPVMDGIEASRLIRAQEDAWFNIHAPGPHFIPPPPPPPPEAQLPLYSRSALMGAGLLRRISQSQRSHLRVATVDSAALRAPRLLPPMGSMRIRNRDVDRFLHVRSLTDPRDLGKSTHQLFGSWSDGERSITDSSEQAERVARSSEGRSQPMSVVPRFRSIVVALTASSSQEDRRRAIAGGCNDFISKPINLHWLATKVKEWESIQALVRDGYSGLYGDF